MAAFHVPRCSTLLLHRELFNGFDKKHRGSQIGLEHAMQVTVTWLSTSGKVGTSTWVRGYVGTWKLLAGMARATVAHEARSGNIQGKLLC